MFNAQAAARAAAAAEQNAKAIVEPKGTLGAQNAVVLFAYDAGKYLNLVRFSERTVISYFVYSA